MSVPCCVLVEHCCHVFGAVALVEEAAHGESDVDEFAVGDGVVECRCVGCHGGDEAGGVWPFLCRCGSFLCGCEVSLRRDALRVTGARRAGGERESDR